MDLTTTQQKQHQQRPISSLGSQRQQARALAKRSSGLASVDLSPELHETYVRGHIFTSNSSLSSILLRSVPVPTTSSAASGSSHSFFSESLVQSSEGGGSVSCAPNLVQLLSSSPKAALTTVLHRPTPIHPVASRLISFETKMPQIESNFEVPLDLSQSAATRQQSVIIRPLQQQQQHHHHHHQQQQQYHHQQQQQQQQTFLPTCANPSLNSNWITIKFGSSAATGPNRMSYPREFKLMVINYYYKNGQNKYRTCKEFQITKSMLNGWLRKIDKIRQSRPGSLKSGRSGRKPQFPDIEKQLFHLYHAHLGTGKKVGNRWIRETARNLAQQQCSEQELAGMCQFSERWLSNFKKRYRINLNRDWSSGNSNSGSLGSSTESIGSSSVGDSEHLSPDKSDETAENESNDSDADSILSDNLETLIDVAVDSGKSGNSFPLFSSGAFPTGQEHIQEILNKPGQLPIQAFYERFPWLCRKNQSGGEPGRRGRKVQFPGVEKVLFERLQQQQSRGERISNRWLQQQARELAVQICPKVLQEATKSARCLFSEHWLHNFKKRYGVTLKHSNRHCLSGPEHSDSVASTTAVTAVTPTEVNANTAKPNAQANLSSVLQLQNWLLAKYYNHQHQPTMNQNGLPSVPRTALLPPLSSPKPSAPPVWYSTPLPQSLL